MSIVGAFVILAALVLLLLRLRAVRFGPALLCAVLGFVVAITPAGPGVQRALAATATWLWHSVASL